MWHLSHDSLVKTVKLLKSWKRFDLYVVHEIRLWQLKKNPLFFGSRLLGYFSKTVMYVYWCSSSGIRLRSSGDNMIIDCCYAVVSSLSFNELSLIMLPIRKDIEALRFWSSFDLTLYCHPAQLILTCISLFFSIWPPFITVSILTQSLSLSDTHTFPKCLRSDVRCSSWNCHAAYMRVSKAQRVGNFHKVLIYILR